MNFTTIAYIKPIESQMNITQKLRESKIQEKELREEIRKKLL